MTSSKQADNGWGVPAASNIGEIAALFFASETGAGIEGWDQVDARFPESLLGMPGPPPWTDSQIVSALQRRLASIVAHPQRATQRADELRFALHGAAAKLLSASKSESAAASPKPGQDNDAAFAAALTRTVLAGGGWNKETMQQVAAIAMLYGKQMQDVMAALGTLQVSIHTPASPAARGTAKGRSAPGTTKLQASVMDPRLESPDHAVRQEDVDPAKRLMMLVGWGLGAAVVLLFAVSAVILIATHRPGGNGGSGGSGGDGTSVLSASEKDSVSKPVPLSAATPADIAPKAPARSTSTPQPGSSTLAAAVVKTATRDDGRATEWADLARDLDGAVSALRSRALGASDRFTTVYNLLALRWPEAAFDERTAAVSGVLDAVFVAAGQPDVFASLLGAIESTIAPSVVAKRVDGASQTPLTPERVLPGVWSAGVLSRLSRERDLPRSIVSQIDAVLASAFEMTGPPAETSFEAGAAAALQAMSAGGAINPAVGPLSEGDVRAREETWEKWLIACRAIRGPQSEFFTRTTLNALERLALNEPEPTRDQSVFDAMTLLTAALPWRAEDASRIWLLRQFDSPGISDADLHVITVSLATKSGAAGVDPTMVHAVGAGDTARAELRDRFAAVWNLATIRAKEAVYTKWAAAAMQTVEQVDLSRDSFAMGVAAVSASRLNQCAMTLWSGSNADTVDAILMDPDVGLSKRLASLAAMDPMFSTECTSWVIAYEAAEKRVLERLQLLGLFSESPTLVEAQVLVKEACRGIPEKVQAEAQDIVRKRGSKSTIVCALLDYAPFMPPTAANTELIRSVVVLASVPSHHDPRWRVAVRRVLVERLLELLAGGTELAMADMIGDALAESYEAQASIGRAADAAAAEQKAAAPSAQATPPHIRAVEAAAGSVAAKLLAEAEALVPSGAELMSLPRIMAARQARERLAAGRVQRFVAVQISCCELLAFIIVNERAGSVKEVGRVMEEFTFARRKSQHVLGQAHAGEVAMLRLWLLRHGEAPAIAAAAAPNGGG